MIIVWMYSKGNEMCNIYKRRRILCNIEVIIEPIILKKISASAMLQLLRDVILNFKYTLYCAVQPILLGINLTVL